MEYCRKAVDDRIAEYHIGCFYRYGLGILPDYSAAMEWFERSAQKEHSLAEFAIAQMFYEGHGVKRDLEKAQEYFMKAANLGDREAQYNVGVYYLHQKDYVVAENWFRKAAKQGFLEAWSALGDLLHERHRYADALENYKYAASAGDAHSQYWLGEMYYRGDTLQENSFTFKESYQRHTIEDDTWFEKFSRGRSIQDDTLAYKWFLEAANQGHADAAYSVGYMHQYGRGANQSYEEAEKWYLAAIDKGNVPAQRSLQRMRCNRAIELAMMSVAEEELSYDEITLVLRNQSTHSLNPVDWARASMEWHSNIADKLRLLEQRRD
ncbi:hypothetical protein F5H01DRAFT_285621 [Linnemannia elongata]|nr:hypothetical protein F5H01DRAFT_285621 [Linnemannia elongata]